MRRLPLVLLAVAVVLAACTSGIAGTGVRLGVAVPGTPRPTPIAFGACNVSSSSLPIKSPQLVGKLQLSCGRVTVPLDYSHPNGRTISLFVVRVHDVDNHTTPRRDLLINPGGPGASGALALFGLVSEVPPQLVQNYDLIGFDPRGVGQSTPIECIPTAMKDQLLAQSPDVRTKAGFAQAKQSAASVAQACERTYPDTLQYFTTVNTARDMDQLRQALGDDTMNYLGFSYGTELGWTYADLFPQRVRAFVLDGAVDPDTAAQSQVSPEQLAGFESAFAQFAKGCRTLPSCRTLGNPAAAVEAVIAATRRSPLRTDSGRPLTVGLAYTGVLGALYSRSDWTKLASGLVQARQGNGTGLLALADVYNERLPSGGYTNILDANTAISCNDSPPGPTDAQVHQAITQFVTRYPLFGPYWAAGLFTCQDWQPHRTPVPAPTARTTSTVLVLGNRNDPATPYAGAVDLTHDLRHAELLTWDGQGHTSYLQGSTCVDNYVTTYLVTLRTPPDNTTCPA